MLQQVCRCGRLSGLLEKISEDANDLNFLEDQPPSLTWRAHQSHNVTCLPETVYETILTYIQQEYPFVRHYQELPHLLNAHVLSPWANDAPYITYKTHTFTTHSTHLQNSSVSFYTSSQVVQYGYISRIWILPSNTPFTQSQTFLSILLYEKISGDDAVKSLYCSYPSFKCFLVYTPEVQQALPDTMVVKTPNCYSAEFRVESEAISILS